MSALLEGVGGMLIAPRSTLHRLMGGEPGGFNDLLLLLLIRALALQLPQLARIGWQALDTGVLGAALLLANVLARAIIVPLIAALVGGLLLRVVAKREAVSERATDLAAFCVVPAVALQIGVDLLEALLPDMVEPWLRATTRWVARGWFAALLLQAALLCRHAGPADGDEIQT